MPRTRTAAATPLLALATLAALGLAAPAARAQDVITFDAFANQPARTGAYSIYQATYGSATFDGVSFSGNANVVGDQFTNGGSQPIVKPHSGNYAFTPANQQTTMLGTAKTLYGLYLGQTSGSNTATSVTINALGANGAILGSLTDTLSSTTLSFFDTSSLANDAKMTGFSGYSLVSNAANTDFAGDDFTFTAPASPPTVSGKYDFDTDSVGVGANPTSVQTTFSDTSGGIVATFSSAADASTRGGFKVGNFGANQTPGFSGNSLIEEATNTPLTVSFDHTLQSGSLAFNDSAGGQATFTLQELLNGVAVGTPVSSSTFGTFSFGGTSFNGLRLSDTAGQFAIDNLNVTNTAAAPEPSEYATLGFVVIGLGALLLKARKRRIA